MGRDFRQLHHAGVLGHFNSHARVGRDIVSLSSLDVAEISTHTPAWGVTLRWVYRMHGRAYFNSHARVGRDGYRQFNTAYIENFNSHARVGRDIRFAGNDVLLNQISTHTPAWGVTWDGKHYVAAVEVFQLTRPRGA